MNKQQKIELHSWHILIILIIGLFLGSIGVGLLVQENPLIKAFDSYFYHLIHYMPRYPLLETLIFPFNYNFLPSWLSPLRMPSYYYFMVLGLILYIAITNKQALPKVIFCLIFGTILSINIAALDWQFVFRERPFLSLPNQVDDRGIAVWKDLSSFPSGHSRDTAFYAGLIAYFIPATKWIMLIFAIFIGFSRVYLGAHYPSDVIAGILIGGITAITTVLIMKEIKTIFFKMKGVTTFKYAENIIKKLSTK